MGGKTQQRVAGNVKPTNSGRIRELLNNQQHGTNNIITFGTLASKRQKNPSQTVDQDQAPDKPSILKKPDAISDNDLPTTPSKENYKLVVKKVGGRDLYARVKFSDHAECDDGTEPSVKPCEAGVKKPSYILDEPPETLELDGNPNKSHDDREKSHERNDTDASAKAPDPEDEYDFDTLIYHLSNIQAQLGQYPIVSLNELHDHHAEKELQVIKLVRLLIEKHHSDMSIEDWDLAIQSLVKWVEWIFKAEHPLRELYQVNLAVAVFQFLNQLITFAKSMTKRDEMQEENQMMQSLLDDYKNFHSTNLFQDILVLYFKLISIENSLRGGDIENIRLIIEAMAPIVLEVDPRIVLSHYSLLDNIDSEIEFDSEFKAPTNSIYCNIDEKKFKGFLAACKLLKSNTRVVLVSAHCMLRKTMGRICEVTQISDLLSSDDKDVDEAAIFPPAALMSILTSRDSMMSALLSDYKVGDISVTIEPNTDSYSCTLSYLFAWDLAIQFLVGIDKEVGHRIIYSLKRLGLIQRLLDTIFMLLPPLGERDSLSFRMELDDRELAIQDKPWCIQNFLKSPLSMPTKRPTNEIELVALHLYFSVALHMPVTVRKWYNNNSNKKLCNLVNEYTVKHVSQVICSLEMESVREKCQERASEAESKNLVIKARPSAKEVYAIYIRDEFKMELTIKLPINYPLGSVQIDGGKRVGVTDNKWRSWLLQLTTFLAHQNGPILDGIDLWKRNIDKRFEGIEKCTICFSILHSNYQLPKKRCQTCANMFHNLCLYKWFESSGNSTCPLCRNPW